MSQTILYWGLNLEHNQTNAQYCIELPAQIHKAHNKTRFKKQVKQHLTTLRL